MQRHLHVGLYLALSLSAATARAQEGPTLALPDSIAFTVPDGWAALPGHSERIASLGNGAELFETASTTGAAAYARASRGALYIVWTDGQAASPSGPADIRSAFDVIHQATSAVDPIGSTKEVEYRERVFDNTAELRFEWAHLSNETVNLVRALAYVDPDGRVHVVQGECVFHTEEVERSRPDCVEAIESLRLTDRAQRAPLDSIPVPAAPDEETQRFPLGDNGKGTLTTPPELGVAPEGGGVVLHREEEPEKSDLLKKVLMGIGLALVGLAFYFTTRRRPDEDRQETDSEREGDAQPAEGEDETAEDEDDGRSTSS
jgi:hypothetical protein